VRKKPSQEVFVDFDLLSIGARRKKLGRIKSKLLKA
jgi:hypothetical protein